MFNDLFHENGPIIHTLQGMKNAFKLLNNEIDPQLAPTPYTVIAEWGRVRLLKYEATQSTSLSPIFHPSYSLNRYQMNHGLYLIPLHKKLGEIQQ